MARTDLESNEARLESTSHVDDVGLSRAARASAWLLLAFGALFVAISAWLVIPSTSGPDTRPDGGSLLVPFFLVPATVALLGGVAALRGGRRGRLVGALVALVIGGAGIALTLDAPTPPGGGIVVLVFVIVSSAFPVAGVLLFRARGQS